MNEFEPTDRKHKSYAENTEFSEFGPFGRSASAQSYNVKLESLTEGIKRAAKGLLAATAGLAIIEGAVFETDPVKFIQNFSEQPGGNPSPSSINELFDATEEHIWDDGVILKEATCTEEGVIFYECKICDKTKSEPIPLKDHVPEITGEQEADCTHTGHTAIYVCANCGQVIDAGEEIPELGHQWENPVVTLEATCSETGIMEYTCSRCGETMEEEIPLAEHAPVLNSAIAATCTKAGRTQYTTCSVCGEVIDPGTVIPALGHVRGETVVTRQPSCTAGGSESVYCSRCGQVYETHTLSALGHVDADHNHFCDRCGQGNLSINFVNIASVYEGPTVEAHFRLSEVVGDAWAEIYAHSDMLGIEGGMNSETGEIFCHLYLEDVNSYPQGFTITVYGREENELVSRSFTITGSNGNYTIN